MTTTALLAAGSYSRSGSGRGPGITLLALDDDGPGSTPALRPRATVDLPDPSFLLWGEDGTVLHAVLETDPSRVVTLRVSPDGVDAPSADLSVEAKPRAGVRARTAISSR